MSFEVNLTYTGKFDKLADAMAVLTALSVDKLALHSASMYPEDNRYGLAAPLSAAEAPPAEAPVAVVVDKPKRQRKGDAAVPADPTPAPETSSPQAPPDSPATSATSDTAAPSASPPGEEKIPSEDEVRALMQTLFTAGKRPAVKAAMDKHGGGALSVSAMTVPNRVTFFTALKELSNG